MRIVQILSTVSYGDAVGNDAIAIYHLLKKKGFRTAIYAEGIDKRLHKDKFIHYINRLKKIKKDDVIIYHLSTGTRLNYILNNYRCRKILIYHNITPPEFFSPYSMMYYNLTFKGYEGMQYLSGQIDYCLADSAYNKNDLICAGYQCPIDVRPILIPFHDYEHAPDQNTIDLYQDDWTNIIFVGRIAPNKKHEDVIRIFCYYKRYINPKSRLILVGSYNGMEKYYQELIGYAEALHLQDVIFTGHIPFESILAYYRIADIFLCMSAHEGFCVPLVEAMYFNVPIIAFGSTAIPYTLGGSGILVDDKDPVLIAKIIDRIVSDQNLRTAIIAKQKIRLNDFSYEKVSNRFLDMIESFMQGDSCL